MFNTVEAASARVKISLESVGALNSPPRPLLDPSSSIDQSTPKTLADSGTDQSVRKIVSEIKPKNRLYRTAISPGANNEPLGIAPQFCLSSSSSPQPLRSAVVVPRLMISIHSVLCSAPAGSYMISVITTLPVSLSVTLLVDSPRTKPGAEAVNFTGRVALKSALSSSVITKSTEDCPSGMVTVSGTVATAVFELLSVTTTAPVVPRFRETVPLAVPAFSATDCGTVTLNVEVSAVAKFATVGSTNPGNGSPTVLPVTRMLSIAHHQSLVPVLMKRNFIEPVSGFGTFTTRRSLTFGAVALPRVLLVSSVNRFVQVVPLS